MEIGLVRATDPESHPHLFNTLTHQNVTSKFWLAGPAPVQPDPVDGEDPVVVIGPRSFEPIHFSHATQVMFWLNQEFINWLSTGDGLSHALHIEEVAIDGSQHGMYPARGARDAYFDMHKTKALTWNKPPVSMVPVLYTTAMNAPTADIAPGCAVYVTYKFDASHYEESF